MAPLAIHLAICEKNFLAAGTAVKQEHRQAFVRQVINDDDACDELEAIAVGFAESDVGADCAAQRAQSRCMPRSNTT